MSISGRTIFLKLNIVDNEFSGFYAVKIQQQNIEESVW